MSRVLEKDVPVNVKPWRAPDLNISEEIAFDYKLTDSAQITHRDQQSKIRQQAYEKSYAKGYMEGLAQGQQEMHEHVEHLHSLMAALTIPLPDLDDSVVDEMAQLCIAMVKQLVRRELKASPDEIIAVIKEALSMLPETPAEATLNLHPEDAEIVRKSLINPDLPSNWKIIEDPLITRGGCRVSTKSSRIDATVESRLNAVIAEVIGDERS
ncbi:MAG: flagellar assembly protein FliH [Gammaproteobacteria bacterium]|nr:MAG: flagellar assembly protein FliH [Gammaproteobacteria bacterium]